MRKKTPMRKLRKEHGLTLADVSEGTGIAHSTVQHLDAGIGADFSIEFKKKIADFFGVDPLDLFPEELEKTRRAIRIVKEDLMTPAAPVEKPLATKADAEKLAREASGLGPKKKG